MARTTSKNSGRGLRWLVALSLSLGGLAASCGDGTSDQDSRASGGGTSTAEASPANERSDLAARDRLSSGDDHTCYITDQRSVECWGSNARGQLGSATVPTSTNDDDEDAAKSVSPVPVEGVTDAVQVRSGERHSCALVAAGDVYCWGYDAAGRLSSNWSRSVAPFSSSAKPVPGISKATSIASADGSICAIAGDAEVSCWIPAEQPTPIAVVGLKGATQLALTEDALCAVLPGGTVGCVGGNDDGVLGIDGTDFIPLDGTPSKVHGLTDIVELAAGEDFLCALDDTGAVWCWGENGYGQLGTKSVPTYQGSEDDHQSTIPHRVDGLSDVADIGAGNSHACAVLRDGTARCWGYSSRSQLGDPSLPLSDADDDIESISATPVRVQGLTSATAVTGGFTHSCAVTNSATVKCWGSNYDGQLGSTTVPSGPDVEPHSAVSAAPVDVQF